MWGGERSGGRDRVLMEQYRGCRHTAPAPRFIVGGLSQSDWVLARGREVWWGGEGDLRGRRLFYTCLFI